MKLTKAYLMEMKHNILIFPSEPAGESLLSSGASDGNSSDSRSVTSLIALFLCVAAVGGPKIQARVAFPAPGVYEIFGEFKQGGTVVTSRFAVKVE